MKQVKNSFCVNAATSLVMILMLQNFVSDSATAQTRTNCRWFGSTWQCDTNTYDPNPLATGLKQLEEGINASQERRRAKEEAERRAAERRRQDEIYRAESARSDAEIERQKSDLRYREEQQNLVNSAVAEAIMSGNCTAARNIALKNNNFQLAEQAGRLCKK